MQGVPVQSPSVGLFDLWSSFVSWFCHLISFCLYSNLEWNSIVVVPPAYYAHLAAFRARYYVEDVGMSESGSTGGKDITKDKQVAFQPLPQVKDNVKEVMFYCWFWSSITAFGPPMARICCLLTAFLHGVFAKCEYFFSEVIYSQLILGLASILVVNGS